MNNSTAAHNNMASGGDRLREYDVQWAQLERADRE